MTPLYTSFARLLLPVPAIALLLLAFQHLTSGIADEKAAPAIANMASDTPLPPAMYRAAARILSGATMRDGDSQIARAEAMADAGAPRNEVLPVINAALAHSPAAARGWLVLAGLLGKTDPPHAVAALSVAIEIAPREYFLVPLRARVGAPLWRYLSGNAQAVLLDDARLLADDPGLRPQFLALLAAPDGAALATRALAGDPRRIRALNRGLVREEAAGR
jgi:hypothetical protein